MSLTRFARLTTLAVSALMVSSCARLPTDSGLVLWDTGGSLGGAFDHLAPVSGSPWDCDVDATLTNDRTHVVLFRTVLRRDRNRASACIVVDMTVPESPSLVTVRDVGEARRIEGGLIYLQKNGVIDPFGFKIDEDFLSRATKGKNSSWSPSRRWILTSELDREGKRNIDFALYDLKLKEQLGALNGVYWDDRVGLTASDLVEINGEPVLLIEEAKVVYLYRPSMDGQLALTDLVEVDNSPWWVIERYAYHGVYDGLALGQSWDFFPFPDACFTVDLETGDRTVYRTGYGSMHLLPSADMELIRAAAEFASQAGG